MYWAVSSSLVVVVLCCWSAFMTLGLGLPSIVFGVRESGYCVFLDLGNCRNAVGLFFFRWIQRERRKKVLYDLVRTKFETVSPCTTKESRICLVFFFSKTVSLWESEQAETALPSTAVVSKVAIAITLLAHNTKQEL